MLTVKFLIVDVIARLGAFLCFKAIQLSGNGHIEFEVGSNQLSYDDENIVTFPVTLSFDYFKTQAPLLGVI